MMELVSDQAVSGERRLMRALELVERAFQAAQQWLDQPAWRLSAQNCAVLAAELHLFATRVAAGRGDALAHERRIQELAAWVETHAP